MYLKALRLKGFKSFPKQTELLFEPGVGVIIGPNGSGKSNLADAVIWALGEQSPTTIRGSSMQDVIFAGSDGRRASGSAEVELTFDNGDGALPLPTPEVSAMRRVARDGSSQDPHQPVHVQAHGHHRAPGAGRLGQGTAFHSSARARSSRSWPASPRTAAARSRKPRDWARTSVAASAPR